jgi:two-component system sensor histidine kinase DegS
MVFSDRLEEPTQDLWEVLKEDVQIEIEQTRRELQEITLLVEQSRVEVDKLAQRNAAITARLQQVQSHFDTAPRDDIRSAYDASLDAQQRLFVMRGQLEKLQSDQTHMDRYQKHLERVLEAFEGGGEIKSRGGQTSAFGMVEAIIQAQESERQRLSRQMHDGPAQALSNFILQTEIAMRLFDMDREKARNELNELKQAATSTFQKVRDFIFELRPMMLDDLGLVPTLKRYVEAYKDQAGVEVSFTQTGVERRLESYIEVMIFRAIQELLGNAVRNNQATQLVVQMDISDANVKVAVEDNGKSFDIDKVLESSGTGIKVIQDRVEMLGGYMELSSTAGQGSRIMFQIPAGSSAQAVFA